MMVGVKVRQHQLSQVCELVAGPVDRVCQQRRGTRESGIDQGKPVGIRPQIGVPDRKSDEVQTRQQLDDVHAATVTACPASVRGRSATGRSAAG